MTMTYLEQYRFRNQHGDFWCRCEDAALTVASAILIEDGGTTNHAARLVWAQSTLLDPSTAVTRMKNRICQHWLIQSVGGEVTDETVGETPGLRQVIESLVNDFAG